MSDGYNNGFHDNETNEDSFVTQGTQLEAPDRKRHNYEYDYGYYEQKPKKENNNRNSLGIKTALFALVFAIIGSLIGGAFGAKLAADRFEKTAIELQKQNSTNGENIAAYTINTSDSVNTVSAVAATNLDSVVGITTKTMMRDLFDREVGSQGMGSGFIVDERGYIVTNDHVVASLRSRSGYSSGVGYADEITVILNDGSQLPAQVLWSDSSLDLAVLKVEPTKALKTVKLGDSDKLVIGEQAIAIGNPLALEFQGTVTAGYVSGLNRTFRGNQGVEMNLIQTDASINSGNSGGPLLNAKGEVIGINTMKIKAGEGMGFSIPINVAKPIVEEVIRNGNFEKVSIGIKGTNIANYEATLGVDLDTEKGAVVIEVIGNSPAEKAGLQPTDIITKVGNAEVEDMGSLSKILYNYKFGDKVDLEIVRNGKTENLELTFEKFEM